MRIHVSLSAVLVVILVAPLATAEPPTPPPARPPGAAAPPRPEGPVVGSGVTAAERTAVAWFGTWKGAVLEAQRSGRPILLMSAAPQCHGISGLW